MRHSYFQIILVLCCLSHVKMTAQQDSVFYTANYFANGFFDRWNSYDKQELIRRSKVALELAMQRAYNENGANYRSRISYFLELDNGSYMDLKSFEFVLAGTIALSGNPEPLGIVNQTRDFNKAAQVVMYMPDDFRLQDGSSPFEYAAINANANLLSNEDLRSNVTLMKESNLTTSWDQDSITAIFRIAHGIICHNDGYEHDNSNCNLHSTSAGGICFTVPSDRLPQVLDRAEWRCNAYEEVYINIPRTISVCDDQSETITFETNSTDVSVENSSGINASVNGDQLTIRAVQDGFIELTSTDGTADTLISQIQVTVLANETLTVAAELCEGDELEMENGEFTSESTTITLVGASANACDRIINYEITTLDHEKRDTIVALSEGEELVLPDGRVVTEIGTYTAVEAAAATNGCDLIWTYTVMMTSSLQDVEEDIKIHLYPNPSTDCVYVDTAHNFWKSLSLYSIEGALVFTRPFSSRICLEDVDSGIYLLEIGTDMGMLKVARLIKL